jgi:hypothetical protein
MRILDTQNETKVEKNTEELCRVQYTACENVQRIPAQLPITQVLVDDPFTVTGVDFAGPSCTLSHTKYNSKSHM